jgi:hypothetical protein
VVAQHILVLERTSAWGGQLDPAWGLAGGTMSSLLREVIPLALGAAISPVIFLLQLTT